MGTRTTYFCDVCGLTAPLGSPASIPGLWKFNVLPDGTREHICGDCCAAIEGAVKETRARLRGTRGTL